MIESLKTVLHNLVWALKLRKIKYLNETEREVRRFYRMKLNVHSMCGNARCIQHIFPRFALMGSICYCWIVCYFFSHFFFVFEYFSLCLSAPNEGATKWQSCEYFMLVCIYWQICNGKCMGNIMTFHAIFTNCTQLHSNALIAYTNGNTWIFV